MEETAKIIAESKSLSSPVIDPGPSSKVCVSVTGLLLSSGLSAVLKHFTCPFVEDEITVPCSLGLTKQSVTRIYEKYFNL